MTSWLSNHRAVDCREDDCRVWPQPYVIDITVSAPTVYFTSATVAWLISELMFGIPMEAGPRSQVTGLE